MMQDDDMVTTSVERVLKERAAQGIPNGLDLWPRIERRVAQQAQTPRRQSQFRFVRRTRILAASCLVAALTSSGLAISASPTLRHALAQVIPLFPPGHDGVSMSRDGHLLAISPTPPFRVFYPDAVSPTLRYHAIGQWHGDGTVRGTTGGILSSAYCPNEDHDCNTRARQATLQMFPGIRGAPTGLPPIVVSAVGKGLDVVWFGMHGLPPDSERVEIAEWDAKAFPRDVGVTESLQTGTIVTLVKDGTEIEVQTNLGVSATQSLADSLHKVDLHP